MLLLQTEKRRMDAHVSGTRKTQNLVLIADDDLFIRTLLKGMLRDFCNVIEAATGAQAIELYKQHMPSMAFLDVHMPELSGHQILNQLKSFDPGAHIVMVSGDSVRNNVIKAATSGAKGFICKPFQRERVMAELHRCPHICFSDALQLETGANA